MRLIRHPSGQDTFLPERRNFVSEALEAKASARLVSTFIAHLQSEHDASSLTGPEARRPSRDKTLLTMTTLMASAAGNP